MVVYNTIASVGKEHKWQRQQGLDRVRALLPRTRKGENTMSKKFRLLLVTLMVVGLLASACSKKDDDDENAILAIEHFSIIAGTTWSGAQDRAGKRIAEKYDNVEYIYREEVGPDLTNPYAEEMISDGADIVLGNAEFMGLPLKDIADKYRTSILDPSLPAIWLQRRTL